MVIDANLLSGAALPPNITFVTDCTTDPVKLIFPKLPIIVSEDVSWPWISSVILIVSCKVNFLPVDIIKSFIILPTYPKNITSLSILTVSISIIALFIIVAAPLISKVLM